RWPYRAETSGVTTDLPTQTTPLPSSLHPLRFMSRVDDASPAFGMRHPVHEPAAPLVLGWRRGLAGNLAHFFVARSGRSERTIWPACHISLSATAFSSFSSPCR